MNMSLSPDHIRKALVQIAENYNRPHYEVMVQRDVIHAFREGVYHPLKAEVMSVKIEIKHEMTESERRLNVIKETVAGYGMTTALARAANIDQLTLSHIICGERLMKEDTWLKIEAGINELQQNPEKYQKAYKKDKCGTYARFRGGCRCGLCVAACKAHKNMAAAV